MPALTPGGQLFPRYQPELYVPLSSPFRPEGFFLGKLLAPVERGGGVQEKTSKITTSVCLLFIFHPNCDSSWAPCAS